MIDTLNYSKLEKKYIYGKSAMCNRKFYEKKDKSI